MDNYGQEHGLGWFDPSSGFGHLTQNAGSFIWPNQAIEVNSSDVLNITPTMSYLLSYCLASFILNNINQYIGMPYKLWLLCNF